MKFSKRVNEVLKNNNPKTPYIFSCLFALETILILDVTGPKFRCKHNRKRVHVWESVGALGCDGL